MMVLCYDQSQVVLRKLEMGSENFLTLPLPQPPAITASLAEAVESGEVRETTDHRDWDV